MEEMTSITMAKQSAEILMKDGDFVGAKALLKEAKRLSSDFHSSDTLQQMLQQMLATCEVHCSSQGHWYDILKVETSSDEDTIKKQYKKLVLLVHPDKNNFAGAEAAFKLIRDACELLTNKEQRTEYDEKLNAPCFTNCEKCGIECEVLREYADTQVICPSCMTQNPRPRLFYRYEGILQGPFPLSQLIAWVKDGYFATDLEVCFADDPVGTPFRDLGSVMSDMKTEIDHAHAHTSNQNDSMSTSKSVPDKSVSRSNQPASMSEEENNTQPIEIIHLDDSDFDHSDISENKKMDCNKEEASSFFVLPCDQSAESSKHEKAERKMMKNIDDDVLEAESGSSAVYAEEGSNPIKRSRSSLESKSESDVEMNQVKKQVRKRKFSFGRMKKVNEPVPKIVFSTQQGLLLLTELKEFYSEKQERNLFKLLDEFYIYVKPKFIPFEPDNKQIRNKIDNLKKKYKNVKQVMIEGEDGKDEVACPKEFKLWQEIWGNPGVLDYKAKA